MKQKDNNIMLVIIHAKFEVNIFVVGILANAQTLPWTPMHNRVKKH